MKKLLFLLFTFAAINTHIHGINLDWDLTPDTLSRTNINASEPQIAIDKNGNAVAIWIENTAIRSSRRPVNGSWSSAVTISGTNASNINLVSDTDGNATAVWLENGVVKAAGRTLNGNWSNSTALSNNNASSPTLCVDNDGDVIAAWTRNGNVEASVKPFGSNWHTKSTLSSNDAARPAIAIGGDGNDTKAVLVWQGTSSDGSDAIFSAAKLINGPWTSPVQISRKGQNSVQPNVAVDPNGNALAIWYAYDYDGVNYSHVVVRTAERNTDTGTWSKVSTLSQPGIRDPETLMARIEYDSIGNAIALWNNSYDDETFSLESAVKPVYENWSDPVDLVHSNLYAFSADLSTTSFGDVLGLYMFYNGASLMIQSIESDINGYLNNFWSVPITISQGSNNGYPKIAASLKGNVLRAAALWINNDGNRNIIMSSSGAKALVLPPSNLNVSQSSNNFGVFKEYYNTLTWNASQDPKTIAYLIFRNGVFIAQVGADVLQYVDNNRERNGSVTYGITAIDDQQMQSRTVSVNLP